jgi:hypothetical protein
MLIVIFNHWLAKPTQYRQRYPDPLRKVLDKGRRPVYYHAHRGRMVGFPLVSAGFRSVVSYIPVLNCYLWCVYRMNI